MSQAVSATAEPGTMHLLDTAEQMLHEALAQRGPEAPLSFPETSFYLPVALAAMGTTIRQLGDLEALLARTRAAPAAEVSRLIAAEVLVALQAQGGCVSTPISDAQVRAWGKELADGRMPGIGLLLGRPQDPLLAPRVVEELRRYNILCLAGASFWSALERVGADADPRVVRLGNTPAAAVHAAGFLCRCAMKMGGQRPGQWNDIAAYCERRTPGFALLLGPLDAVEHALAGASQSLGLPAIAATNQPYLEEWRAAGLEPVWLPPLREQMHGTYDAHDAGRLVERCLAIRGLRATRYEPQGALEYGPAFEDETIPDPELFTSLGGEAGRSFALVQCGPAGYITDGCIKVMGPDLDELTQRRGAGFGLMVEAGGPKLQADHELYLERQVRSLINYLKGVRLLGSGESVELQVSWQAASRGFMLQTLGEILHARLRSQFKNAVDKVQVTIVTDPDALEAWLVKARSIGEARRRQLAALRDDTVDVFYACTRCRSFAPRNVSIITPERVSPCGQCSWLEARAARELDPASARIPLAPGRLLDAKKGIWEGLNQYARTASGGRIHEVALYSIMDTPLPTCGDFECLVVLVPEANGVAVVAHEDAALPTPAGMTSEAFASLAAGEQIPGMLGVARSYLLSPKFLLAEGGLKRVVWMSSRLQRELAPALHDIAARQGYPDIMDCIASEQDARTVAELVAWLEKHAHPALGMPRIF